MPSLSLGLSLRGQLSNAVFNPKKLFTASEVGVWFDISDTSTLFQDSAGTTPITATGQPVGKILDKSGNNLHATQATATQRPTYQIDGSGKAYLSFDGVDDNMVTGTITPATNKAQVFAGARKLSDTVIQVLYETSTTTTTGTLSSLPSYSGAGVGPYWDVWSSGASISTPATYPAPQTVVQTHIADISAPVSTLRINGVQAATSTASQGAGNFISGPLNLGRRAGGGFPFNGRLYGLILRFGPNLNIGQIASAESWINSKTGAY